MVYICRGYRSFGLLRYDEKEYDGAMSYMWAFFLVRYTVYAMLGVLGSPTRLHQARYCTDHVPCLIMI